MKEVKIMRLNGELNLKYILQPEETIYIRANDTLYGTRIGKDTKLYNDTRCIKASNATHKDLYY